MNKKIGVFADGKVGYETLCFLLTNYVTDVEFIVLRDTNSNILNLLKSLEFNNQNLFYSDQIKDELVIEFIKKKYSIDFLILSWWPYIVKKNILDIPKIGTINFHPSLLPYNRGKNYNFWTIVENSPFGVTLHLVDEGIDTGDILFQKKISKDWTDTGETLYHKAQNEILSLFYENYDLIRFNKLNPIKQEQKNATFHFAKDLEKITFINLDSKIKIRDFLNLARAKTFPPHKGLIFEENGIKYEINLKINKI